MKIGLIGEDPYDTDSIKNLLTQKYPYRFIPILKNLRGTQLDSPKAGKLLKIELKTNFPGNPMFKREPKEYLKTQTRKSRRKFDVFENPSIFKKLRIEKVIKNCPYFKNFIITFEQKVAKVDNF